MSSKGSRGRVIGSKVRQSPQRSKKKTRKRAEWDDTISDLSQHRASSAELARRQMVALSQNLERVRQERLQKRIRKAISEPRVPTRKTNYLTKEVLYDSEQLGDVLAKSDRAMSLVKDMFGDDPQKYRGVPNVTIAPLPTREGLMATLNQSLVDDSTLGPSKLDLLSDTCMDRTALNESDPDQETDEEQSEYQPQIDVERFKKLLALAEAEAGKAKAEDRKRRDRYTQKTTPPTQMQIEEHRRPYIPRPDLKTPADSPVATPKATAINDTGKCQRTMARTGEVEESDLDNSAVEETVQISNIDDLKKVLSGLETNIGEYEKMTGRQPAAQRLHSNTFSGYTVGLIDAVTRMTTYLKESELRLRAESTIREQLAEDVLQTRALVDALTSDIIATQEEYAKLQADFTCFRRDTSQQIAVLKQSMEAYGIGHAPIAVPARYPPQAYPPPQPASTEIVHPKPQHATHQATPSYPSSQSMSYPSSQAAQYSSSQTAQYSSSQPSQYSNSQPTQYSISQPPQYSNSQPPHYSRAGDSSQHSKYQVPQQSGAGDISSQFPHPTSHFAQYPTSQHSGSGDISQPHLPQYSTAQYPSHSGAGEVSQQHPRSSSHQPIPSSVNSVNHHQRNPGQNKMMSERNSNDNRYRNQGEEQVSQQQNGSRNGSYNGSQNRSHNGSHNQYIEEQGQGQSQGQEPRQNRYRPFVGKSQNPVSRAQNLAETEARREREERQTPGYELGHGDSSRVRGSVERGDGLRDYATGGGDYQLARTMPQGQARQATHHRSAEPTDRELGEQMSAALGQAVGRQHEDAYLITPPHQTNSPGGGENGVSVPQNSTATRALQFHQPQEHHNQQPRGSAFEAYTKKPNQREEGEARDPMTGLDAEGKTLLDQIAELNRAHEEAHRKLSQLQTSQLQNSQLHTSQLAGDRKQQAPVSPPISPISFADSSAQSAQYPKQSNMEGMPGRTAREIRIALPSMNPK